MHIECKDCHKDLGEMLKGKIHNKAIILCTECYTKYNTYKSLADLKYNGSGTPSCPPGFEDIFGKFTK